MSGQTQLLPVSKRHILFQGDTCAISDATTLENMQVAADAVRQPGTLVAFPTETVYGLGGSAFSDESVGAIYKAKNRPADNPLIVHVASAAQAERLLLPQTHRIPEVYAPLVLRFWPGPLTILLPVESGSRVSALATVGQATVAVRVPGDAVARALIAMSDTPLAAPSANASTRPSPTLASHVMHDLAGKVPLVLDGGACRVGLELTVVDGLVDPPVLLRPGGISVEQIRLCGGRWLLLAVGKSSAGAHEAVRTPGMKYRHYSPTAQVVLFEACGDGRAAVKKYVDGVQGKVGLLRAARFSLAAEMGICAEERSMGATEQAVARLMFRLLREMDDLGVDVILVEGVGDDGDGLAVMNRLRKAAAVVVRAGSWAADAGQTAQG